MKRNLKKIWTIVIADKLKLKMIAMIEVFIKNKINEQIVKIAAD